MIRSTSNTRVKAVRRLHRPKGRRDAGCTLLEGPTLVAAAMNAGAEIEVWSLDDDGDVQVTQEVLAAVSTTQTPQNPIGVLKIPESKRLRTHRTVVLWDLGDPGNVGTILRTAAALDWDVCVTPDTVDVWAPKVLRAGAGAHFAGHMSTTDSIDELRAAGLDPVASLASGGDWPIATTRPPALLIGAESAGLPRAAVTDAGRSVTIPSSEEVESLNAGIAAAILMWELGPRPPAH